MEPFGLRLEFPLLVRDDTVDLGELEDGPGAPTKYTVEEILVLLLEKGLTNKEWWPEAKKKVKCSEKTFRVLKGVATANELILEEEGDDGGKQSRRFVLTEEGEKLVTNYKNAALRDAIKHNGNGKRSPSMTKIGGYKGRDKQEHQAPAPPEAAPGSAKEEPQEKA